MAEDGVGFNFLRDEFQRIIADESAARAATHLVMNEVAFEFGGAARNAHIGNAKEAVSRAIEKKFGEFRPDDPNEVDSSGIVEGSDFFLF